MTFTVDFFLAAEWKFLAQIIGIEAATARYFVYSASVRLKIVKLLVLAIGQWKTPKKAHAQLGMRLLCRHNFGHNRWLKESGNILE